MHYVAYIELAKTHQIHGTMPISYRKLTNILKVPRKEKITIADDYCKKNLIKLFSDKVYEIMIKRSDS